ncbi:MAG: hypothetical protein ACR2JP_05180 [Acidimicrobiia bacterium]
MILLLFSYFTFAAAFTSVPGGGIRIDQGLLAISLALAPLVFVVFAFVSRHRRAPSQVLKAMGLYLIIGLPVGLVTPALGSAAGFGAGAIVTLAPPDLYGATKRRIWSVVAGVLYTLAVMAISVPAGLFTGAMLPVMAVGFADEYSAWRETRAPS